MFKRWTYRDRKLSRRHFSVHWRRQHLRRRDLDSLHAGEFTIDSLAGGSSGIRWQRQPLGQRHERRCCANHDWRADGNTHANTNCHTNSYANSDSNNNAHSYSDADTYSYANSHAYSYSDADTYRYPKTNTETTPDSAAAPAAAVRDQ
jgi:hypothetical protein